MTPGNQGGRRDDRTGMRCSECRDAASARLDGEQGAEGPSSEAVDAHLEGCAACRTWVAEATGLHRVLRVRSAETVVDRTDHILAAVPLTARPRPVREGVRFALLAIGLAQVVLALPALVWADEVRAPVHVAREMGAFELALGVGLLATVWRPRLAAGLLPFAGALAAAMFLAAGIDVVQGDAVVLTEAHHVLDLVGLALLALLQPRGRPGHPPRRRVTRRLAPA